MKLGGVGIEESAVRVGMGRMVGEVQGEYDRSSCRIFVKLGKTSSLVGAAVKCFSSVPGTETSWNCSHRHLKVCNPLSLH